MDKDELAITYDEYSEVGKSRNRTVQKQPF